MSSASFAGLSAVRTVTRWIGCDALGSATMATPWMKTSLISVEVGLGSSNPTSVMTVSSHLQLMSVVGNRSQTDADNQATITVLSMKAVRLSNMVVVWVQDEGKLDFPIHSWLYTPRSFLDR